MRTDRPLGIVTQLGGEGQTDRLGSLQVLAVPEAELRLVARGLLARAHSQRVERLVELRKHLPDPFPLARRFRVHLDGRERECVDQHASFPLTDVPAVVEA